MSCSSLSHKEWYTEDQDTLKKNPGLVRRSGGTFYARLRVPSGLVEKLSKQEIKVSLKTKDRVQACARLPAALQAIQRIFAAADSSATAKVVESVIVPNGVVIQLVRKWFEPLWNRNEDNLWMPRRAQDNVDDAIQSIDMQLSALQALHEETVGEYLYRAKNLLTGAGYENASSSSVDTFARLMIRGEDVLLRRSRSRLLGGVLSASIEDPVFRSFASLGIEMTGSSVRLPATTNAMTVEQSIQRFYSSPDRKQLSRKSEMGHATGFKLLREIAGAGALLRDVTRDHTRRIQQLLEYLPPRASVKFPAMSAQKAAEHARHLGIPAMQAKTAENILASLSTFFNWAVREHLIDKSPSESLQALQSPRKKDERRRPFLDNDLSKLFSADLFAVAQLEAGVGTPGRYWVPLLALFLGARMNELCQLLVTDVREEAGILFIDIAPTGENGEVKRLKTKSAERQVPVHPFLLRLGFLTYVKSARSKRCSQLFTDLTMSRNGYYSDNFSKWFARFTHSIDLTDRRLNFHSFRHGFADACRASNIPDAIADALGGWSMKGSTRVVYGKGYSLRQKADELAKISFPAVEHLLLPLQVIDDGPAREVSDRSDNIK